MSGHRRVVAAAFGAWISIALAACGSSSPEEVESEAPVSVRTAKAAAGDIRGIVHATAVVTPAPDAELVIVAPESARIAEIRPAEGDRVRRGDVLVRFELPNAAADVQKQEAEVKRRVLQASRRREDDRIQAYEPDRLPTDVEMPGSRERRGELAEDQLVGHDPWHRDLERGPALRRTG